MALIKYRLAGNVGERRSFDSDGDLICRLYIPDTEDGYVTMGATVAPLRCGVCRIDMRTMPDGEYSPLLFVGGERIQLEGIIKRDGSITAAPTPEYVLRGLLNRVLALEEELDTAKADLASLREKTEKRLEF